MLCNILDENETEVDDVPWRRRNPPAPSPSRKPPDPGPSRDTVASEELVQLRARLAELQTTAEARINEAREAGFRAGETAARKSLEDLVNAQVEALAKTVTDVSLARADAIRRAEGDTVRLAIEIARRVLHRELSVDPSSLEALIKAAIGKLQNQEVCRVRVHPGLEPLMRRCLEQAGRGSSVEVLVDRSLPAGGASFEIGRGTLDASLDTQLREIENGLVDEIRRRS